MKQRLPKQYRDMGWLLLIALAVRLLAALPQQQPNYMDAAYSYVNGLNLAAGRGFVEDFVWNYLDAPAAPPHPSHLYWMPLSSILAWLGLMVGGDSYRAAQIPFVIVSALLAPITYYVAVAVAVSGQRRSGWLAALLAIFSGFYFPFWTAIDNFAPFSVASSLALILAWRGMETGSAGWSRTNWYLLAAGIMAGLAHLARADGLLLLAAIGLMLVWQVVGEQRSRRAGEQRSGGAVALDVRTTHHAPRITTRLVLALAALLVGYLLVMLPWFWRNWAVTGTMLPTAGSQTIWLATAGDLFSSYSGLFSYGRELSARTFLAQGIGPILQGRWWVLGANLQTVMATWGMIFLAPLALMGFWSLRRQSLMQLAALYGLLLFVTMTLVFAFPGALGGLFHSGGALLPFIYAAAVVGLDRSVVWVAARRRHWRAKAAKQVFGIGLVVLAVVLTAFLYYRRVLANNGWNGADALYPAVAAWVAARDPGATVMINNPPAYRFHGGGLSVVIPNEALETTLQAAADYGVEYLILEPNHPAPLSQLYYDPNISHSRLRLVETMGEGSGTIYIFEVGER